MSVYQNFSECTVFPPEPRVCGPGGLQCIQGNEIVSAVCECEEGWTNIGDFANWSSGPCDMNIFLVRLFWGIMSGVNFFSFLFASWYLRRRLGSVSSFAEMKGKFGGSSLAVVFFGVSGLCFTITGALHVADPIRFTLGGEIAVSFMYSLSASFFWIGVLRYFSNLINVAHMNLRVKSEKFKVKSTATLAFLKKYLPLYNVFLASLSFFAFFLAIANTNLKGTYFFGKYDQLIIAINCVGIGITCYYLGVFEIPRWLDSIIEDCEAVLNVQEVMPPGSKTTNTPEEITKRLHSTVAKFKFLRLQIRMQGMTNGTGATLFGCWGYLTHKTSYMIPLSFISGAGIAIIIIWSLANFATGGGSKEANDSKQGSGKKNGKVQNQSSKESKEILDRISSKLKIESGLQEASPITKQLTSSSA